MRTIINTLFALAAIALITSCNSKGAPNYQYFPNMYESIGYEAYSSHEVFSDNHTSEALKPVDGTVNRGWLPYDYANSAKGYANAKANGKNPLPYTEENAEKGKALYDIYCAICHGAKGDGKGTLVKREKILGVPSYDDAGRILTEGSIYHVMCYGINSMRSYAAQTSIKERWQIVQYVQSLKASLEGKKPRLDKSGMVKTMNDEGIDGLEGSDHGHESDEAHHEGGDSHDSVDEHHDGHDGDHAVEKVVGKVKKKASSGKKDILGGKSHHSHK